MGGMLPVASMSGRQIGLDAKPEVLTREDVARLLAEQANLREQLAQLTEERQG